MFRPLVKFVLIPMMLLLLGSALAVAQKGRISGQVTDPEGKAITGAAVHVVAADGSLQRDAKTDASGMYAVAGLPAGSYMVVVEAEGFDTKTSDPLALTDGQELTFNQQVTSVKAASQSIEVTGGGNSSVELDSATISGIISNEKVNEMPLNGRNALSLLTTTAGVSDQSGQDERKVGIAGSAKFSVNGGRVEYNTFEVDGSDVLNTGINASRGQGLPLIIYPSIDAIQDMQVITSNYGAMYGKTASGTVIVTTKSGGAQFHGDLYGFVRNEMFNARNYFDAPGRTPLYRRQDYGGTIGGPLYIPNHFNTKKDNTFFFFSEELRLEKTPVAYNQAVPTVAERNGDFTDLCPAAASNGKSYNLPLGQGSQYPDCPLTAFAGAYSANNQPLYPGVPNGHVNLNYDALAMLSTNIIPMPNSDFGCNSTNLTPNAHCYTASVSPPTYWREELFRIDHNLSQTEQISFRYAHDAWNTTTLTPQWGIVKNSFPTVENKLVGPGLDLVLNLNQTLPHAFFNRITLAYSVSHISLTPQAGPGVTSLARPAILDDASAGNVNSSNNPYAISATNNGASCNLGLGSVVTGGAPTPPGASQPVQTLTECPMGYIFNNGFGGKMPGLIFQGNNGAYGGHGFSADTGYAPWAMANPTYLIRDDVSKAIGKHTLQFGIEATLTQQNELSAVSGANSGDVQGLLTFSNQQSKNTSNNAFADFLAGPGLAPLIANATGNGLVQEPGGTETAIKNFTQDSGQGRYYNRYKLAELYLQDDWRVTSRLTVNAGFRASLFGAWYNAKGTAYNWEPQAYNQSVGASIHVDNTNGFLASNLTGNPIPLTTSSGPYSLSTLSAPVVNGLVQCGVNGVPKSCMQNHLFNPAPRVGLAWDPFGGGRTSIRAGYGLFWEHGTSSESNTGSLIGGAPLILSETQSNPGPVNSNTNPEIPLTAPFPSNWSGAYNQIGYAPGTTFPLNVTSIPTKAVYPYTQQWSLSIQRELRKDLVGTIAYVGTKGTHLTAERDLNQLQSLPNGLNPFPAGQPVTNDICSAGAQTGIFPVAGTIAGTGATTSPGIGPTQPGYLNMEVACTGFPGFVNPATNRALSLSADTIRQYNGLSNILSVANIANSNYSGLQATLRRTKGALTLGTAYTWSHSLDEASDRASANFADSLNLKSNYASSDFDQRQLLSVDYIYALPLIKLLDSFTHFSSDEDQSPSPSDQSSSEKAASDWKDLRLVKNLLDHWQLSGVTVYQTGTPFSVVNAGSATGTGSADNAGVGDALGIGSFADRIGNPRGVKPVVAATASTGSNIGPLLLNPAAFAAPRGLTFGDSGRNSVNNPSRTNFNMSLLKHFTAFTEQDLEFRMEVFNVFNHTQFRIYDPSHPGNTGNNIVSCYGPDYAQYSAGFTGDTSNAGCVTGNSFMHPVDAHDPRIMQFGLKLAF
jgi:hypothetical protein